MEYPKLVYKDKKAEKSEYKVAKNAAEEKKILKEWGLDSSKIEVKEEAQEVAESEESSEEVQEDMLGEVAEEKPQDRRRRGRG